jgi:hypothetical protein
LTVKVTAMRHPKLTCHLRLIWMMCSTYLCLCKAQAWTAAAPSQQGSKLLQQQQRESWQQQLLIMLMLSAVSCQSCWTTWTTPAATACLDWGLTGTVKALLH